jgi:hypothetical protein
VDVALQRPPSTPTAHTRTRRLKRFAISGDAGSVKAGAFFAGFKSSEGVFFIKDRCTETASKMRTPLANRKFATILIPQRGG